MLLLIFMLLFSAEAGFNTQCCDDLNHCEDINHCTSGHQIPAKKTTGIVSLVVSTYSVFKEHKSSVHMY
ncbi:hypothetical protein HHUSO_G33832 [Huso huso]|uniref:UPAR/Ly6 domain-containing protein n=1 Tax=Huso huso TaxID=61971 RepID=A0ABR0Y6W7_HUSHU